MIKVISQKSRNEISYKHMQFSGGEINVTLDKFYDKDVIIQARITTPYDQMLLFILTDALRRSGVDNISLDMPYLPYARQDRVMNEGESLSLKVFCDMINTQNYKIVRILDCHSDVGIALLDRVENTSNHQYIKNILINLINIGTSKDEIALVSPDAGSLKKIYKLQKYLNDECNIHLPIIEAGKTRDTATGQLSKTVIYTDISPKTNHFLIVDDICDGGRTFINLSNSIKKEIGFAIDCHLFITHGIFSYGLENIFTSHISYIYTTDSFHHDISTVKDYSKWHHRMKVFPAFY